MKSAGPATNRDRPRTKVLTEVNRTMSSANGKPIPAVAYCRCSTSEQINTSIPQQKDAITKWAAANGMDVVRWFADEGLSGTTDRRPAYQELLEEARQGKIKTLLIASRDRLSRQHPIDYFADIAILKENAVQLISLAEGPVNWHDEHGWLLDGVKQSQASGESVSISARALRGMAAGAAVGRWQGGKPPYGYRVRREQHPDKPDRLISFLEQDPEQAESIRFIFRRYVEGASTSSILAELPRGWKRAHVRKILSNPRYVRPSTWYATTKSKFHTLTNKHPEKLPSKGTRRQIEPGKWVAGIETCPAIIDEATWDAAQARRQKQRDEPAGRKHRYALSGLAVCGHCGVRMAGHFKQANGKKYLECEAKENRDIECAGGAVQEAYLLDGLAGLLTEVLFAEENRAGIRRYVRDYVKQQPRHQQQDRARKEAELKQLDRRHDQLQAALATGGDAVTVILQAMGANRAKAASLVADLASLPAEPTIDPEALENQFWRVCGRLGDVLKSKDPDHIRAALAGILDRLEITWTAERRITRHVKRIGSVKVIFKDDPLLRVLLSVAHTTACRYLNDRQLCWTVGIATPAA